MRIRTRSILIMTFTGLTQASQLILGILLVRLISMETLGSYRQVVLVHTFIAGIFTLQIDRSLYYFLPRLGLERRRELLTQTLLTTAIISLAIGLTMFLTADLVARQFNNPSLVLWIRLFSVFPIFESIMRLQPAFMISLDKALHAGLYSMFGAVLTAGAVLVVFLCGGGIAGALAAKIFISGVAAMVGLTMMAVLSRSGRWAFNKSLWLEQINYCWPFMASTTVGIINIKVGGFLISMYFPPEVYAVFSIGAVELPVIALFTTSLASAIMPNMVVAAKKGNYNVAFQLWHEAARKSSLLIFPTFAFFIVCGYDFIVLLYTPQYADATWPFLIYLAKLPIKVVIYASIFQAIGHTKPIAVSALLALIANLIVSVVLVRAGQGGFLSFIGPCIGSLFATAVSFAYLLLMLCKKMDAAWAQVLRWRELGHIFLLSLLCGVLLWLIPVPVEHLLVKMIIRFILYVLLYAAVLFITKSLKPDEKELMWLPLSMIRRTLARKVS